jgi:hypothetical protein
VTAEGADDPPEGGKRPDFEHSLPLHDVMDRAILRRSPPRSTW